MKLYQKISIGLVSLTLMGLSYVSYASQIPINPTLFETYLASPIGINDTSLTLAAATLRDGSTLSGYVCLTVDANSPQTEYMCGIASGTSVINLTRGIDAISGTTTTTALNYVHRRGADVKVTDYPILTILGRIFSGIDTIFQPISYSASVSTSSLQANGQNLATVNYVNGVAFSGAGVVNATAGASGIVQLATPTQAANSTAVCSSGASCALTSSISTSTFNSATAANKVLVTGSNGSIDGNFFANTNFSGTAQIAGIPFLSISKNIYFASTTQSFVTPTGVTYVYAQCVGGGGAGGGTGSGADSVGGGGGGGAYVAELVNLTGISSTLITIGAGGTGVSAGSGNAGGNTTFGSFITANGGLGGSSGNGAATVTVAGGSGGTASYTAIASTSVFSVAGTSGGYGFVAIPTAGNMGKQGDGGGTFWHGSIPGLMLTSGNNFMGTTTQAFGVGGAGSLSVASALNQYGSPGSPGACLITY